MSEQITLVLVHGIGGSSAPERWMAPLNPCLRDLGFPSVGEQDRIITMDYMPMLADPPETPVPPVTWEKGDSDAFKLRGWEFMGRRARLAQDLRRYQERSGSWWEVVPPSVASAVTTVVPGAAAYVSSRRSRAAVWSTVLSQLPPHGHVILVGHSLGSVVVADILDRLPPGVTVDLVLTLGSPLSIKRFRASNRSFATAFPYDRVHRWVNVFDPADIVSQGRGISGFYPEVIDVLVSRSGAHELEGYMAHPAVASAIGLSAFGRVEPAPTGGREVVLPIDPKWSLHMLQLGFTHQVSKAYPSDKWVSKGRLDLARRVWAQQLVDSVAGAVDDSRRAGVAPADWAFRSPDLDTMLHHPLEHLDGQWSDDELASLAVSLFLQRVVPPFDIDVAHDHRQRALAALLNRVRRRRSAVSDHDFATAVQASVEVGRAVVQERARRSWAPVLAGVGLAVLAATGIGLVAAVPAGLAGAAAITATLAAFGPGGMVGGIVALATLTGTGSALTTLGAAGAAGRGRTSADAGLLAAAVDLASMSADEMQPVLAAMLAVVELQDRLELTSTARAVEHGLLVSRTLVDDHLSVARKVAPDRPGTKDWERRAELLGKALAWLGKRGDLAELAAERHALAKAIESA